MKTLARCPICNKTEFTTKVDTIDYTVSKEPYKINTCQGCGFHLTSPQPEDLAPYYQSDQYISHTDKPTDLIQKVYQVARKWTLAWKEGKVKEHGSLSILDYGCGTGDFLNHCKSNGWMVFGVEPSDTAREIASQKVKKEIYQSIDYMVEKVSVISLWHVLEHVPDLSKTIQQLKERLAENGTMFIAVPNLNSWDAQVYQQYWAAYDTPRHLWHFRRKDITALFERHEMKVIETIPMKLDAFYISLMSEQYRNQNRALMLRMIKAFFKGIKSNLKARKTGEYSSLIYVIQHNV